MSIVSEYALDTCIAAQMWTQMPLLEKGNGMRERERRWRTLAGSKKPAATPKSPTTSEPVLRMVLARSIKALTRRSRARQPTH
eukprot:scaffold1869_cov493-Prasinococcus_capsulatus_cf.AAC.1